MIWLEEILLSGLGDFSVRVLAGGDFSVSGLGDFSVKLLAGGDFSVRVRRNIWLMEKLTAGGWSCFA